MGRVTGWKLGSIIQMCLSLVDSTDDCDVCVCVCVCACVWVATNSRRLNLMENFQCMCVCLNVCVCVSERECVFSEGLCLTAACLCTDKALPESMSATLSVTLGL